VVVNGQIIVKDGQLLTADMPGLIAAVNGLAPGLLRRRGSWLAGHAQGAISPIAREKMPV
jgi:hypothetical protein